MADVSDTNSQLTKQNTHPNLVVNDKVSSKHENKEIIRTVVPRVQQIKTIIYNLMTKKFNTQSFSPETSLAEVKEFADLVKTELRQLKLDRYKIIVQAFIGEQKDQGVSLVNKCFWDSEVDYCITNQYMNDQIFVVAVVYLVYVN